MLLACKGCRNIFRLVLFPRTLNSTSRLLKKAVRSRRLDELEEIVVPWILRGDLASANEDLGEYAMPSPSVGRSEQLG